MRIKNQTFDAERVELDGNSFENCIFNGSTMYFTGSKPVSFLGCEFHDVRWEFSGAAALTVQFLKALTDASGDYGRGLLMQTFPAIKEWVKPENFPLEPGAHNNE